MIIIEDDNDIRYRNIGNYQSDEEIYDAQLIPGSDDLVIAAYSDYVPNLNGYPGTTSAIGNTQAKFSMLNNAMSYIQIFNGTASNPYNFTAFPSLTNSCGYTSGRYICPGWNTWELFITNIEAVSHEEIFITTEGGYGTTSPTRSISFLGKTISIPSISETVAFLVSSILQTILSITQPDDSRINQLV